MNILQNHNEIVVLGRPKDKEELLDSFSEMLEFPDYFGRNWDALAEILTSPETWYRGKSLLLILDLSDLEEEAVEILEEILKEAHLAWRDSGLVLEISLGHIFVRDAAVRL